MLNAVMDKKPDFSGYVTKYNILCTDGRTIKPGAFKELDGQYVPLVYMHNHRDLDNVLGKMLLEHRDDGVYGYGFFNSTDRGKTGKALVDHGDISCLSIFANQLKQQGGDVLHGNIQEVSLVLAGANRGAIIDSRIAHSDNEDEEAFICMGDLYSDGIYINDEDLSFEDYVAHYGVKGMKWGEHKFLDDESSKGIKERTTEKVKSLVQEAREKENELKKAKAATEMVEKAEESVSRKVDTDSSNSQSTSDSKPSGSRLDTKDVGDILDREDAKDRIKNRLNELATEQDPQNDRGTDQPKVSDKKPDKDDGEDQSESEKGKDLSDTAKAFSDRVTEKLKAKIEETKRAEQTRSNSDNKNTGSESNDEKARAQEVKERIKKKIKSALGHADDFGDYISHSESKTYSQILDEMTDDQINAVAYILKEAKSVISNSLTHSADSDEYLMHYGRKGMKWGEHRFLDDESSNDSNTNQPGSNSTANVSNKPSTRATDVVDQFMANRDPKNTEKEKARQDLKKKFADFGRLLEDKKYQKDKYETPTQWIKLLDSVLNTTQKMYEAYAEFKKHYSDDEELRDALERTSEEVNDYFNKYSKNFYTYTYYEDTNPDNIDLRKDLKNMMDKMESIRSMVSKLKHADDDDEYISHADPATISAIFDAMTDEQKDTVYYLLNNIEAEFKKDSAKHSDEEDNSMKENTFDMSMENGKATLSHAQEVEFASAVFADFKRSGSLKDAFLAHAGDYGIDQIDWLFPDAKNVTNTPIWIKRPDGWVPKVMNAVSRSPFSRIKSMFADITEPDARAKGYIKGNRKTEEVFGLLKRTTTPTTVYKKQKLDRDDIIDITDFDVVAWLKTEMRGMLDEELARALLVSDGRSPASDDKINEQNIRPIWTDDDLFVIRKAIAVTSSTTVDEKCKQFIRAAIKARKDYRGSGNPVLYTTEDILTDMLLMEDNLGHPLYETEEKLCRKLRVKEIVTVPVMENLSRVVNGMNMELMGIIVNLTDYKVGADKGGAINMFDDFDIDYNQQKYLIETRCSGALTVPYSAIVIEATSSAYLEIEPDDPDTIRYGKDVADLQDNVIVNDDSISGTLKYVTGYTGFSGDIEEQSGNYLAFRVIAPNGATNTLQLVGGGASGTVVDMQSDDYAVVRIKSKNTKIVLTSTINGLTVTKTYSLRLLKLLSE